MQETFIQKVLRTGEFEHALCNFRLLFKCSGYTNGSWEVVLNRGDTALTYARVNLTWKEVRSYIERNNLS